MTAIKRHASGKREPVAAGPVSFAPAETFMIMSHVSVARRTAIAVCALVCVGAPIGEASAQTSTKPGVAKPQTAEPEVVRIRGNVDSVDERGVVVQLSQGINIRVDLQSDTPIFAAQRIRREDLKAGDNIVVRTRAAQATGEPAVASEVLSSPQDSAFPRGDTSVVGAFRAIDASGERPLLTVADKDAERRIPLTNETAFWRLRAAKIADVRAGMSMSVLITRDASNPARVERAMFGSPAPGTMLPL
jgi:hypothetical protein